MKAMQAMTRNVVCIQEADALETARDIMREWDIRHLPVVRGKKLVGILSNRDVLLYTEGVSREGEVADRTVAETMSVRPITCLGADSVSHIAGLMLNNKIDCIPVVNDDGDELIGLVTTSDLLELLKEKEILDASRSVPWNYAVRSYGRVEAGFL